MRQLGLAYGGTVPAAAIVTGVFLAGLGVGARLGGEVADRTSAPARVYGGLEAAVAVWGVAVGPLLVGLAAVGVGGLAPEAHGWWAPTAGARMVQVGVAVLLLGPPTVAMGASLPLLARPLVGQRIGLVGWRVALLGAANTGGAALGALLGELVIVPAFGVRGSGWVAAACGVAAAGLAWRRGAAGPAGEGGPEADERHDPASVAGRDRGASPGYAPGAVAVAAGLAGLAGMGFEVVWFRFLGSALGPYRAVFSLVVGTVLVGWLLGALVAGAVTRSRVRPATAFAVAQGCVAALALAGLVVHDPRALLVSQLALADDPSLLRQGLLDLVTIARVVLPAAIAMGAAFPLTNALVHRDVARVGREVGRLWVAATAGNAAGALLTGLVFLPTFGMQGTALLLAGVAAAAPVVLYGRAALFRPLVYAGFVPVCAFALLPAETVLWRSFPHGRAQEEGVLAVREGLNETVVVTGQQQGPARLWTNGHPMSSTTPKAQRYMRLLAHLPLLAQADPKNVLVICFGVGNTLHAASLHPGVEHLLLADLSPDVLAVAPWFAHANRDVLADPRVRVHLDDGRHVLHTLAPASLDVVTLEPPPIAHAGVSALYSREMYTSIRDHLVPGGWVTQWLPAYQVPESVVRSLVRAFVDVFPDAALIQGEGREFILVGVKDGPVRLDAAAVSRRLAAAPAVAEDLRGIDITGVSDLVATFAADGDRLRRATAHAAPVTDDTPIPEASMVSHVMVTRLPADLLDPEAWPAFCPELATDPALVERMHLRSETFADDTFLRFSNLP